MNIKLKELKNIQSENCITIILNTHRTFPDSEQDSILLKNLVREAENRLLADFTKREVELLITNLNKLADSIDHRTNLESLILFVNEDFSEYTKLPVSVENRVVIDNTFATRDLIRAMHRQDNYYVLVLNRDNTRLIEAFNNKVVTELGNPFPFENRMPKTDSTIDTSDASRWRSINAEYFNQVDKMAHQVWKNNPLPIFINTEESNFHEYLKIVDKPQIYLDIFLSRSRQTEKAEAIVLDVWEVLKEYNTKTNNQRKDELKKAVTLNKFLSDTNDIFRAIKEGRIQTLFIEEGLFQPGIIKDDEIQYVSDDKREEKDIVDDVYDELIEFNMDFGGDVVFLPKGELSDFNGFGAITRY